MAAGDFCELADLKSYLKLSVATEDTMLERLISACSNWIKAYINRDILEATYTQNLDGTGGPRLCLSHYPITAITSLVVDGGLVPPSALMFNQAIVTRTDGYKFSRGLSNVTVTYTAGYPTTPPDIAHACIELAAWRYHEAEHLRHASKTIEGETVAFQTSDAPASVKTLLKNWKKVVPA